MRKLAAVAVTCAVLLSSAGCGVGASPFAYGNCGFPSPFALYQQPSPATFGISRVVGHVQVVCDEIPERYQFTMFLEYRYNIFSRWTVRGNPSTAAGDFFGEGPAVGEIQNYEVGGLCVPGRWRIDVDVAGNAAQTGKSFGPKHFYAYKRIRHCQIGLGKHKAHRRRR